MDCIACCNVGDVFSANADLWSLVQANIKVQGRNNRPQMLKLWLSGLVQLVGDHAKAAVANYAHIDTLLDRQTGLRILATERTE